MHDLLQGPPKNVLDIGAGTGRDATWIAGKGHVVVAVEPADEFRRLAQRLHSNANVRWVNDRLPKLKTFSAERFDWIILSAVWMHVHSAERAETLARLKALLSENGKIYITLRIGRGEPNRGIFRVSVEELRALALPLNLTVHEYGARDDLLGRSDIHWMSVVLRQPESEVTNAAQPNG
ncbi:hypothetical protein AWN88_19800 [Agrobacterium tumefaciens]|nr:hypothetical protein AWN88_19800 [Agrobacterium tumefaciens]